MKECKCIRGTGLYNGFINTSDCDIHTISITAPTGWRNQYPLSTYTGRSKEELIEFIEGLLKQK